MSLRAIANQCWMSGCGGTYICMYKTMLGTGVRASEVCPWHAVMQPHTGSSICMTSGK